MPRSIFIAVLAIGLSGCFSYHALVPAGTHDMGPYVIDTPISWSRGVSWPSFPSGGPERWTVDGDRLESLFHFNDVEPGSKLFSRSDNKMVGSFRANMRSTEIVTFFMESFRLERGARALRLTGMAPAHFGSWEGFSFDFAYEAPDGLPMLGMGTGAVIDDKLQLIVYVGTRDHHFEKYKDNVRHIIESVAPP